VGDKEKAEEAETQTRFSDWQGHRKTRALWLKWKDRYRVKRENRNDNDMKRMHEKNHMYGCGCLRVSIKHQRRNDVIRKTLELTRITDKIWEARRELHGHMMRREGENRMNRIMASEVTGRRSREQLKRRWGAMTSKN